MSRKQKKEIARLQEELELADKDYLSLVRDYNRAISNSLPFQQPTERRRFVNEINTWKKKYSKYSASISIDLWPIQDWFRLKYCPYTPGKAAQFTIGPLRGDFYQS